MDVIRLSTKPLALLLESDGHALVPISPEQRLRAAMELRRTMVEASSDDEASDGFRRRLESVSTVLTNDAEDRLGSLPIVFIESALPHASLVSQEGRPIITICRGLFDLIHFRTALTAVCSKLNSMSWNTPVLESLTPAEAMMLAGQVVLRDAYSALRSPSTVADMLSGSETRDLELGVCTSLLLLVLHEIGHHALGHSQIRPIASGMARITPDRTRETLELEADAFAINAICKAWRPNMLASLISLFDVFHFFEVLGLPPSAGYPEAGARLSAMIDHLGLSEKDAAFARSWLDGYARRRDEAGTETLALDALAERYDKVMDVRTAYEVIDTLRARF